jgi:hypothetical protein
MQGWFHRHLGLSITRIGQLPHKGGSPRRVSHSSIFLLQCHEAHAIVLFEFSPEPVFLDYAVESHPKRPAAHDVLRVNIWRGPEHAIKFAIETHAEWIGLFAPVCLLLRRYAEGAVGPNCIPISQPRSASGGGPNTARNALGCDPDESWRENATMLYGEIHPNGHFRFVDFGHPPPFIFSAESEAFMEICTSCIVQFLPLGMAIPEDHPDRNRYLSMAPREHGMAASEMSDFQPMHSGDILFLYTDGVYDGSDEQDRLQIEQIIREHQNEPAKTICDAILGYAVEQDERLKQIGEEDRLEDKTVFIMKRTQ